MEKSTARGKRHPGYVRLRGRIVGVGEPTLIIEDAPTGRYWMRVYSYLVFLDDRRDRTVKIENVFVSGWLDMHLVEPVVAGLFLFDMRHAPAYLARPASFLMGIENREGRVFQDCGVLRQAFGKDLWKHRWAGGVLILAGLALSWLAVPILLAYWGYRRLFARDIAEIQEAMKFTMERYEKELAEAKSRRRNTPFWYSLK